MSEAANGTLFTHIPAMKIKLRRILKELWKTESFTILSLK